MAEKKLEPKQDEINAKSKVELENTGGKTPEENKPNTKPDGKKVRLRVKNKTGRPTYYRAGLCFTKTEQEFEVTEDIAEVLQKDAWLSVEIVK